MEHTPKYFDAMFADDDDPWKFRSRWYEQRKRAVTLAALTLPRYGSIFEPGCANGELSAELAARCDRLLVTDGSPRAIELARRRLADVGHAEARQAWVPADWPDEQFDLIVISELGYFLSGSDLTELSRRSLASLKPGGSVLACHWRWKSDDCEFDGDEVNLRLKEALFLPNLLHIEDRDFVIDVWCRDATTVAQHDGIVS